MRSYQRTLHELAERRWHIVEQERILGPEQRSIRTTPRWLNNSLGFRLGCSGGRLTRSLIESEGNSVDGLRAARGRVNVDEDRVHLHVAFGN